MRAIAGLIKLCQVALLDELAELLQSSRIINTPFQIPDNDVLDLVAFQEVQRSLQVRRVIEAFYCLNAPVDNRTIHQGVVLADVPAPPGDRWQAGVDRVARRPP